MDGFASIIKRSINGTCANIGSQLVHILCETSQNVIHSCFMELYYLLVTCSDSVALRVSDR